MIQKFVFIGGDARTAQIIDNFERKGCGVCTYGIEAGNLRAENIEEALRFSKTVILPLPVCVEGDNINAPQCKYNIRLDDIIERLAVGTHIIGGKFPLESHIRMQERAATVSDIAVREDFAVMNAVPTCEGALAIAMNELPVTLHGSRVLITGFGRIGRVLAYDLKSLGAHVTVAARGNKDLAWADNIGVKHHTLFGTEFFDGLSSFDLIINTIPYMVLDEGTLRHLRIDSLIIDLASRPGGVDFGMAKNLGLKTIWALSLPAKVAPITAAKIMETAILNSIAEEGEG